MMLWGSFLSLSSSFRLVPPLFSLFSQSHCIFPRGIRDVGGRSSYYEKVKRLTLSLVIFFLLFVKLRLKGQRTTICKYFYSLAIKIVFCLRFGQKSDTIIDDNS